MRNPRRWRFSMIVLGAIFFLGGGARAEDAPPLGKAVGPWMVLAYSFRGPRAEELAQALATELREDQGLPAFLFRRPDLVVEKIPEVAVLVGDAGTPEEASEVLRRVKEIRPRSLAELPPRQADLRRAQRTVNPLRWAETASCMYTGPVNVNPSAKSSLDINRPMLRPSW